ncbi:ABC transporter permease [Rhizobium sp. KVB221]|uniref:Spermidine/putrescine transport system permease protein PotC n=1 Tax=Rhizobium setariae TaxID=2801340 RepID=A0A936YW40_9HYPH|nr:ABC transporter permease [Rhizobium setariae]MBL0374325.1 ABC transporter permease [Rhizobium setariae]
MRYGDVKRYPGFGLFLGLFFLYLYVPIIILVVHSFNDSRFSSMWGGFSLRWYASALQNKSLLDAVLTSFKVGIASAVLATVIALMAALILVRGRRVRYRNLSTTLINLPLFLPEVVLAVAMLILFSRLGIENGMLKLIIAHTTFCTPFAFLPIRARMQGMSEELEEAGQDLYATPWKTFWRVTLPTISPGVFAGAMLAFLMSMDDFITSMMLNGGGSTTLPVYIFSLIRNGTSPELNAISALVILASLSFAAIVILLRRR